MNNTDQLPEFHVEISQPGNKYGSSLKTVEFQK